ncbi:hrp65 protein-like isoform X2 [Daphnia magna]|uniref:hrp65 protein-like isoform X2 n=1 Tax=Daphnia magna TaxID=35525 RepID=UPI001E1BD66E|nr:hrp65 protein-like isoform X2 [Daphnia magna]
MQKLETASSEKLTKESSPVSNAVSTPSISTPQNSVNGTAASVGNNSGRGKRGSGRGGIGRGGQSGRNNQGNGKNGNNVGRFQRNTNQVGQSHGEKKWEDNSHGNGHQKLSEDRQLLEKLASLSNSTADLPIRSFTETKFSGRSRLYVGNLGNDIVEQDLKEHFSAYGEIAEVFLNKEKGFAFVRLDYRSNSEKAKRELDGKVLKGRTLRVRSAPHSAAIRVKNLSPFVTNELLEKAFSIFGDIERAIVVANERGQSTNEGVVEFVRKPGAQAAIRRCTDGCFFLTSSLRPVVVEPMEQLDDEDGFSERAFAKKTPEFTKERETGPRFAEPNSFQFTYGQRWKQLLELYKQKMDAVERELKIEEDKLVSQMEYARYEHETELLREQLRLREQDRERQKRDWELKERQHEESRLREEETLRRQQDEMQHRLRQQEDEMRRRQQENNMFMQEQNTDGTPPDFRRPLQPPTFDRPMMGGNGPHNLMDLQMGMNKGMAVGSAQSVVETGITAKAGIMHMVIAIIL